MYGISDNIRAEFVLPDYKVIMKGFVKEASAATDTPGGKDSQVCCQMASAGELPCGLLAHTLPCVGAPHAGVDNAQRTHQCARGSVPAS